MQHNNRTTAAVTHRRHHHRRRQVERKAHGSRFCSALRSVEADVR